jgi:hypothetical protein
MVSSMALQPLWALAAFLSSVIYTQSVLLLGRVISPSQGRYLHTGQTQTQNKCTQIPMPRGGFESTIPAFQRADTVHALDGTATVIGLLKV